MKTILLGPESIRQNAIDRMREVAGLLTAFGIDAALPRLERHIADLEESVVPRRELSTLTEEEARELFRLAFGFCHLLLIEKGDDWIRLQDGFFYLRLQLDGKFSGYIGDEKALLPEMTNVVAVVRYLDALGIALGNSNLRNEHHRSHASG